ncbi:hypothetical protein BD408DRAFT_265081 [Parasitella parasitica]|nr:hypothetical protein BD408DRAFT_265081 [Parasitella parasitica]
MSVCVSPDSPRGQSMLERVSANEHFPSSTSAMKPFDPVRPSTPLRRIIEDNNGRRHSIANMDSNRQNHATMSSTFHHHYNHKQHYHHHASFPGHYSAPSSPPLQPTSRTTPYTATPLQSIHSTRRNSTALIHRKKSTLETRRMSLNNQQYSRNSHMGKPAEEEHIKDDMEGLYSRSPELRISHKLAERKRRKEMKDLFEELRNALPVDKTLKTSKWEILSKAVEYISLLRDRDQNMERELISLKHQLEDLKK